MQVHLESSGAVEYPESVASALISIVREALTNVAKHAGTHEATVRLCLGASPAYIEVEDQGAGFDPGAQSSQAGHMGLAEMAHRASEIGWHLSIDTHPGRGTRIRIEA
jgi:signal transduction histidine kinase